MFTGIIEEMGQIREIEDGFESKIIQISCKKIIENIKTGDSISVNGCCLTVKKLIEQGFSSDLSWGTLSSTTFKVIKNNDFVNLENSLKPSDRIGGHFVTGHIDDVAELISIEKAGTAYRLKISFDKKLAPYIAPKGSVCLDGVSLTIADVDSQFFTVFIIPHTFENTTLKFKKTGEFFNLEVDLIARYIGNYLKFNESGHTDKGDIEKDKILKEKLIKHGFIR